MPKNPAHRITTRLVRTALERILPTGWYVDSQEPITLLDSEPEPDVVVLRGETQQYLDRHPDAPNIALVVEVADTTLQLDRGLKKRAYARAGLPIYWIVNLVEGQIEVYTQPSGEIEQPDYEHRRDYQRQEGVPVVIAEEFLGELAVEQLLVNLQ